MTWSYARAWWWPAGATCARRCPRGRRRRGGWRLRWARAEMSETGSSSPLPSLSRAAAPPPRRRGGKLGIAVVTYRRPERLRLLVGAIKRLTQEPYELVAADDG